MTCRTTSAVLPMAEACRWREALQAELATQGREVLGQQVHRTDEGTPVLVADLLVADETGRRVVGILPIVGEGVFHGGEIFFNAFDEGRVLVDHERLEEFENLEIFQKNKFSKFTKKS